VNDTQWVIVGENHNMLFLGSLLFGFFLGCSDLGWHMVLPVVIIRQMRHSHRSAPGSVFDNSDPQAQLQKRAKIIQQRPNLNFIRNR
jgi:hypothetical protein